MWKQLYLTTLVILFTTNTVSGEELPLYELGIGIAGLSTPHYLGSAQNHDVVLPVPYPIYRGEWFRADNSGVKTFLIDDERFDLNISLNATLPVDSTDNRARRRMPDLDWLLEIGPTMRYIAWQNDEENDQIRLDFPLRGAFSADGLRLKYQGLATSPGLAYFNTAYKWHWTASYAAIFGNRRYHGYFYDVKTAYATFERPEYRASAGYTASRFTLSVTRRIGDWFIGGFVRYDSLHGSTNKDSPLLRQDGNLSAGFILAWFFKQSETKVTRQPEETF